MNNMSKKEFVQQISEGLRRMFPEAEIEPIDVNKLNGASYEGLSIKPIGSNVAVTISLEEAFLKLNHGMRMDVIVDELEYQIQQALEAFPKDLDIETLASYEGVKNKIILQLIPVAGNEEMLANVPHYQVANTDLAVVYRINIPIDGTNEGSVLIKKDMLERYGVSEAQLHSDGMKSAVQCKPATLDNMNAVMQHIMGGSNCFVEEDDSPMWVASVAGQQYGACVIEYPGFLDDAANKIGGNLFILPSSIHEVLLVRDDGCLKLDGLEEMVKNVNQTEVAPVDRLSDDVYYYDTKEHRLEKARDHVARTQAA